ncbi:MAG: hypothetical protein ABDH37_08970, partial [Candidatus Hydrothermales bacterium]
PIYHKTKNRVEAHIFVAVLGYLVERAIYEILKRKRLKLSVKEVINFSKSLDVIEIEIGKEKILFLSQDLGAIERRVFEVFDVKIGRYFSVGTR